MSWDAVTEGVGLGDGDVEGVPVPEALGVGVKVTGGQTAPGPNFQVAVVHSRVAGPVDAPDAHTEASEHQPHPLAPTQVPQEVPDAAHTSGDDVALEDGEGDGLDVGLEEDVTEEEGVGVAVTHTAPPANAQSPVVHCRPKGPRARVPDAHSDRLPQKPHPGSATHPPQLAACTAQASGEGVADAEELGDGLTVGLLEAVGDTVGVGVAVGHRPPAGTNR